LKKIKSRIESFGASARWHGTIPTLLSFLNDKVRHLVEFEICRVESSPGDDYTWADLRTYETRLVQKGEFRSCLSHELQVDYDWAFDRGDMCTGSIRDGKIVGFTFYTIHPTIVHKGLLFNFSSAYLYSYGSMTAPLHRGNKLEKERWKVGSSEKENAFGSRLPAIWYVNVANLAIRTANKNSGAVRTFHGYTAYARIFGRWVVFSSPKCKQFGAGFVKAK
jgi:hypothetical protein